MMSLFAPGFSLGLWLGGATSPQSTTTVSANSWIANRHMNMTIV